MRLFTLSLPFVAFVVSLHQGLARYGLESPPLPQSSDLRLAMDIRTGRAARVQEWHKHVVDGHFLELALARSRCIRKKPR